MTLRGVTLTAPVQTKMTGRKTHSIPHGLEFEWEWTLTGAEGDTILVRVFSRRIELEDSYSQSINAVYSHGEKVLLRHNNFVSGQKGEISGEVRYDDIEAVTVRDDGSVVRHTMPRTAVLLKSPVSAMQVEEMLPLMTSYFEKKFGGGTEQTLHQFLKGNAR